MNYRSVTVRNIVVLLLMWLVAAIEAGDSSPLILDHADYNENSLSGGKLVSILKGNVHFTYEDASILSKETIWYRTDGIAKFSDSVHILRPGQHLSSKRLDFFRDKKQVVMTGDVVFYDSSERVQMLSQKAVYHLETKNVEFDKSPRLMQFDTLAGDTLHIISKRMAYDDTLKKATALDEVEIIKGDLHSTSQIAYYFPDMERAWLRQKPHILYGLHTLDGDSVDLVFRDQLLCGIAVRGEAKGVHNDFSARDSVVTEIAGDSLYMSITRAGGIDTTWAFRDVKSSYYTLADRKQVNEATGKVMRLDFNAAGKADHLVITGNAQSVYYVGEESGDGRNEASGDRIDLYFRAGKAVFLTMTGAVRGIYFAQKH